MAETIAVVLFAGVTAYAVPASGTSSPAVQPPASAPGR